MNKIIEVRDMTGLYRKEILLYGLFDIHFKTPVRMMRGVYFILLSLIWGAPIIFLFGYTSVYVWVVALGIPIVLSDVLSKPVWGGKPFPAWVKTQFNYMTGPKIYYDNIASKPLEDYIINHEYTVSRAKDYYKLLQLEKEEHFKMKKSKRRK